MGTVSNFREVLRNAASGDLPEGWVYFASQDAPTLDSECFVVNDMDGQYDDDEDCFVEALAAGYPVEGLDTPTLESTAQWVRQFAELPSDELLLESYIYYWRFDAFLPRPGSPDPPPWPVIKRKLDREFYDSLGDERPGVPCREPGCTRGAVSLSALCRVHHFENVKREACPFDD